MRIRILVPWVLGSIALAVCAAWFWKSRWDSPTSSTDVASSALPGPSSDTGSRANLNALPTVRAPVGESTQEPVQAGRTAEDDPVSRLLRAMENALSSSDPLANEKALMVIWPELIARDRAAALELLKRLPPGSVRANLDRILAREWAAVDFAGAIGWIATLDDPSDRRNAFESACLKAGESNPAEAVSVCYTVHVEGGDSVLENLIQNWAEKDLSASLAWARAMPAGKQHDEALARIAFVLAKSAPAEAASLIGEQMTEGTAQTEAALSVLHQWALQDLPGATAWVQRFPDGPLAMRARSELANMAQVPPTPAPTH